MEFEHSLSKAMAVLGGTTLLLTGGCSLPDKVETPVPNTTPTATRTASLLVCESTTVENATLMPSADKSNLFAIESRSRVNLTANFRPQEAIIEWKVGSYSPKLIGEGRNIDRFKTPRALYQAPQNNLSTLEEVTVKSAISL